MQYIAFDSHKKYTFASVCDTEGKVMRQGRIEHSRDAMGKFLSLCESGSPVAVETIGNWYWIIEAIEKAGMDPKLVHTRKAKLMMGMINKTDKLDTEGLNRLQRNGVSCSIIQGITQTAIGNHGAARGSCYRRAI